MADCLAVTCNKGKFVIKHPKELSECGVDYKIVDRKRKWFLTAQEKPFSDKQKSIAEKYGIAIEESSLEESTLIEMGAPSESSEELPEKIIPIYKNIITCPLEKAPYRIEFEETEKWRSYLRENGYVVIKNVLSSEKVEQVQSKVWDFLESLGTEIDREDKSTWVNQNWPNTFSTGIISQYGVGQSDASWTVRVNPRVRKVYEKIFETRELLTSFDGFNAFRPPSDAPEGKEKWVTKGLWPHLDQNYYAGELYQNQGVSVQGAVNLIDNGPEDGGFVCIPKSNTLFKHLSTKYSLGKTQRGGHHFVPLGPDHKIWTTDKKLSKLQCVKVSAGAGDLILWDSTVIHWNTPVTNLKKEYDGLARCVIYVCMAPKEQIPTPEGLETLLKKRQECVQNFKTTSHWPTICAITTPPRWPRKSPLKPIDSKGPQIPSKVAITKTAKHLILGTAPLKEN